MWEILDIIIIGFVILSAIVGYKRGLIYYGIHIFAFIVSLIISFILYRPIGNIIINTTDIDEAIQKTIQTNAEVMVENQAFDNELNHGLIESAKNGMIEETSRQLSYNIVYFATIIILFLILRICLALLNSVGDVISKLPIIGNLNRIGGVAIGAIRALLIVYIILMIISMAITVNPQNPLANMFDDTYIAKTMMENNILNHLWDFNIKTIK